MIRMKVFVSSVVKGAESYRDAASHAAASLGHEVKRSEDFPALSQSPEQACLDGVRWADVVLVLLGSRYGSPLASGLSATHEEYREARERRPVLAFVHQGVDREPAQAAFTREVQEWQGGRVTAGFTSPADLQDAVVRALHELEMSQRAGSVDEAEMTTRAQTLLPTARGFASASLCLIVVGGPRQPVLRPAELEDPGLQRDLLKESLVGVNAVLSPSQGTESRVLDHGVLLEQSDSSVVVDDLGSVRIVQPARDKPGRAYSGLPVLIEEEVTDRLKTSFHLAGHILDRVDPVHRLSHVLPVVAIRDASFLTWRTREEHALSPNQAQMRSGASDPEVALLAPSIHPRAVLLHDTERVVADFVSVLRSKLRS
jgi:hypothetical protein